MRLMGWRVYVNSSCTPAHNTTHSNTHRLHNGRALRPNRCQRCRSPQTVTIQCLCFQSLPFPSCSSHSSFLKHTQTHTFRLPGCKFTHNPHEPRDKSVFSGEPHTTSGSSPAQKDHSFFFQLAGTNVYERQPDDLGQIDEICGLYLNRTGTSFKRPQTAVWYFWKK